MHRARGKRLEQLVSREDQRDIAASLDGREEAFARLVRRYEARVAAQMWRFTRDRAVLAELVQDVFVEVYASLPKFRGKAPFLHWVRRIATRVGYRHWKTEARETRRKAVLTRWHEELSVRAEPEESRAAEELHTLLAQLPPADRLILTLHYFEQCSMQEIAQRTGWSRTLVKVRAHRARRRLRGLLEEAGYRRRSHA